MEPSNTTTPPPELATNLGEAYEIPERGSLGLLALGYAGLMLWRHKRAELRQAQPTSLPEKAAPPPSKS
jgi:hypothetical protein